MSVRPAPGPHPCTGPTQGEGQGRGTFRGHGNLHFQRTAERSWEVAYFQITRSAQTNSKRRPRGRFSSALLRINRKLESQLVTNTAEVSSSAHGVCLSKALRQHTRCSQRATHSCRPSKAPVPHTVGRLGHHPTECPRPRHPGNAQKSLLGRRAPREGPGFPQVQLPCCFPALQTPGPTPLLSAVHWGQQSQTLQERGLKGVLL